MSKKLQRDLAAIIMIVGLLGVLTFCFVAGQSKLPDRIEEDDPAWDCHTMGNRICGPGHG